MHEPLYVTSTPAPAAWNPIINLLFSFVPVIRLLVSLPVLLLLAPASTIPRHMDPTISSSASANTSTYRRRSTMNLCAGIRKISAHYCYGRHLPSVLVSWTAYNISHFDVKVLSAPPPWLPPVFVIGAVLFGTFQLMGCAAREGPCASRDGCTAQRQATKR